MSKGYIFDYGGTLDTEGCHWGKVLWHAYQRHNIPVGEEQFRKAYVYAEKMLGKNPIIQSDYTFRQTLAAKLRIEFDWLEWSGLVSGNFPMANSQMAILDDIYERVRETTARSREVIYRVRKSAKVALVSNFYGNMSVVLREFGLEKLFDAVLESAVVGVRKPDSKIFELGVNALGLKPEDVTVVGDSLDKDIAPAKSIGCHTIWLKGEPWDSKQVDETLPDRIITSLGELSEE